MTWLPVTKEGTSERDSVLGLQPEVYSRHQAFLETCATRTDPDLLELSRALMAHMLGCREELARHSAERLDVIRSRDRSPSLSKRQQTALTFVEQFVLDPASISADQVADLEAELGTSGVIDFAAVIAGYEASLRLSTLLDLEPAL